MLEEAENNKGLAYINTLDREYRRAMVSIEADIAKWYTRIATNNGVTLTGARKLLDAGELAEFKWTVDEYIKYGTENALNGQWIKQLENASARVHISRLEAMKIQLQQETEILFGNQLDGVDSLLRGVYSDGFYHTAYEVQKGAGVAWNLQGIDKQRLDRVLSRPWTTDGKTFSDRVWINQQRLVSTVQTELTQAFMRGESPEKTIERIMHEFEVSRNQAARLVLTESAYFAQESQRDCFKELGVEEYEIVETLDGKTCELCADMDGRRFKMAVHEPGVTAPPFHPYCRGTTAPVIDDEFASERAARDEDGKTVYMPPNTTYKDWKEQYVKAPKEPALESAADSGIIKLTESSQVKDALLNTVGFDVIEPSFDKVDDELQVAATNQLAKLEDKFGCIHNSTGTICAESGGRDTVAYVSSRTVDPTSQNLSLCPSYYSAKDTLINAAKSGINSGFSMPAALTDDELMKYTVTHEYGHILQNTLFKQAYEAAGWSADDMMAFVDRTKKTSKARLKWYYNQQSKVKKECFDEIVSIARENNDSFSFAENISKYGRKNYDEFFAEVFANSQLSKPNELGEAMNIWPDRKGLLK